MTENAKVTVVTNYTSDPPEIQLDQGLIRQALFNLIQNSIQAMPKGGRIYITTQPTHTLAGRGIEIEIRDTGVGIPPDIQEQIFDAYFTTKESEGGMGLGLAIAHQIITAHQGRIELKSQVGMGTAFQIYLPIKSPVSAPSDKSVSHKEE
jgi:signal transduction histidine kinase